jgi:hypothetical protein
MVISKDRAPEATERAYGCPRALIRVGIALSHASISSKVREPISRPWNSGRMWDSTKYRYLATVVGSMSSSKLAHTSIHSSRSILGPDRSRHVPRICCVICSAASAWASSGSS